MILEAVLSLALLQSTLPWTQPGPPPVVHATVERFKDLSPSMFVSDGPVRAVLVVVEPTGFRVTVMQRNGARLGPFHFLSTAPDKARIEIENK